MAKRIFDIVVSALLLILLSPAMLAIALAVRLGLGSPVIFRHQRPGFSGESFFIYKFRTMTDGRDESGRLLPDERRLTRLGKVLRSTSLDELPELVNVLKGEMSLVGPRPLMMEYLPRYTPRQARRHEVRPGITGWAQVNGRNTLSWKQRLEMDVWYVDHRTFWLDLRILSRTVLEVISRRGISAEGHATMYEFMGDDQSSDGPA